MTNRILVTRSRPGADATAHTLTSQGYVAIVEPLIRLESIPAEIPAFDALAFTSVNGVRHFARLNAWREGPVWCVGDRTAAEARAIGYKKVRSASGDVSDLATLIAGEASPDARLLHAGNEDSRGDLVRGLTEQSRNATFLPIYRSLAALAPGAELSKVLAGKDAIDAILVHSPKAGGILAGFAAASPQRASMQVAAISEQAAVKLCELGIDVVIAERPNEEALFVALSGMIGRG